MANSKKDWDNIELSNEGIDLIILEIPEGVTEIEPEAYFAREDIGKVVLPSTVKKIGKSAFQECVNLSEINFPQGLVEIEDFAFWHTALGDFDIPDEVKHTKYSLGHEYWERETLNESLYEFVDSCDIKKHLLREKYKFTTLQAVWLVWHSRWASLGEKFDKWNDIMRIMPDCTFVCYKKQYKSLFKKLREYIKNCKLTVEEFFAPDSLSVRSVDITYTAMIHAKNELDFTEFGGEYSTLCDCLCDLSSAGMILPLNDMIMDEWKRSVCTGKLCRTSFGALIRDKRYDRIKIKKSHLGEEWIEVKIFPYGDIQIRTGATSGFEAHHLLELAFEDNSFLYDNRAWFPLPFKRGDLVSATPVYKDGFVAVFDRVSEDGTVWGFYHFNDELVYDVFEYPMYLEYRSSDTKNASNLLPLSLFLSGNYTDFSK